MKNSLRYFPFFILFIFSLNVLYAQEQTPIKQLYKEGQECLQQKKYQDAYLKFSKVIESNKKYGEAYLGEMMSCIYLEKFNDAINIVTSFNKNEAVFSNKIKHVFYYYCAVAYDSIGDYGRAANIYNKAIFFLNQEMPKNEIEVDTKPYYVGLGNVYIKSNQLDLALESFNAAYKIDPKDENIFLKRAQIYEMKKQYSLAATELDNLIAIHPKKEYLKLIRIKILTPVFKDDKIFISSKIDKMYLTGQILDTSQINQITINNTDASYKKNTLNPIFTCSLNISKADSIIIFCSDIYGNKTYVRDKIFRDDNPPQVTIMSPKPDANNVLLKPAGADKMTIIGKILDESYVKLLLIDGQYVHIDSLTHNPSFSTAVNIAGKYSINISASDIFNNTSTVDYLLKENSEQLPTIPQKTISEKTEHLESSNQQTIASVSTNVPKVSSDSLFRGSGDPLKGLNVSKTKEEIVKGNYYALIIGVDKYSGQWQVLKNAVHDAKAIQALLLEKYKVDYFDTLYNEKATRSNILNTLEKLVDSIKETDNLLIYFSGHGVFKQELNKGFWVPYDAKTNNVSDLISNNDLLTFLSSIKSKHTLLISDACFSGDIFRGNTISIPFEESEKYYTKVFNKNSRQAMTSGGMEPVMDGGKDGHSVFAYYLLKTLSENQKKYFDAGQLYDNLKIPVVNNSDQTPILNPVKNTGDEGGQFIFIKK